MDKIVIVMPSYNEAENIGEMIEELFGSVFPEITGAEMHLLIVDDNSPDGTGEIVKSKEPKYSNLHLLTGQKEGLGWAYVRGFKYAVGVLHADAVIEMDADFQHPPKFVKPLVQAYLNGADYVIGSRYVKGGSVPKSWALFRKLVSYFGNMFIRIVLLKPQYHDLTTGFRLTRVKGVLDQIDLDKVMELKRFAHKVHLYYLSTKLAKKVVEIPLEFAARTKEKSKFSSKEMIATFKVAIILGIKDKEKFIKFGTVGFVGYLVNAIALELFSGTGIVLAIANIFIFLKTTPIAFVAESSAWAAAMAAELAIINNFTFNNIWTFREVAITEPVKVIRKFLEFNLTSLGAIMIQFIVIGFAVMFFGDTRLIRQLGILVSMPMVLSFNFVMYNLFIWKTWKLPSFLKR